MTDQAHVELRKQPRVKLENGITINNVYTSENGSRFDVEQSGFRALASDISEGGLGLRLEKSQNPTAILNVEVKVDGTQPITAFARLAWRNGQACGFQFIGLNVDFRRHIREYVEKRNTAKG